MCCPFDALSQALFAVDSEPMSITLATRFPIARGRQPAPVFLRCAKPVAVVRPTQTAPVAIEVFRVEARQEELELYPHPAEGRLVKVGGRHGGSYVDSVRRMGC